MAVSNVIATFPCDLKKVWDVVTTLSTYAWRSDLNKIEILSDAQFVEYTKEGYATTFTTTVMEPYRQWEFDMENDSIKGHWIGLFTQKDGHTYLALTEDVTVKKLIIKPFAKIYLKKQQVQYIADLKRALGC